MPAAKLAIWITGECDRNKRQGEDKGAKFPRPSPTSKIKKHRPKEKPSGCRSNTARSRGNRQ